jgi:hypothetical protein
MNITYKDIIKHSPRGSEAKMWDEVERVDCLIDKLRKENPEMARKFMREAYEAMNGKHINEWLAREMVEKMWHGEDTKKVMGELVTPSDAMQLLAGMEAEKVEKMKWDAYVAANAFMHDSVESGVAKNDILRIAKHWWFHDADMDEGCHKVYWYFKDWIFG